MYHQQLTTHFGDQVFRTLIPRNVRIAEAPSHGMPIMAYDKSSRGAISYLALAGSFCAALNSVMPQRFSTTVTI